MNTDQPKSTPESMPNFLRFVLAALVLGAFTATALALDMTTARKPFVWSKQDAALPDSIVLYSGLAQSAEGLPMRAWYVDIDYNDKNLQILPGLSASPKGKEPVSEMARAAGAYVAVNGGYFDMTSVPTRTFSLVRQNNATLVPNITRIGRPNAAYFVGRSAFGVRADRSFAIDWIWHRGNTILEMPAPLPNTPLLPAPVPTEEALNSWPEWRMRNAVGGGPTLLKNGVANITYNDEVFFGSGFRADVPYRRTAVGFTPKNHLILLVTDSRRDEISVGLTLGEVADELKKLGCSDAMNLDGGGSTTLVVGGKAINVPAAGAIERHVSSMLAIVPATNAQATK